MVTLKWKYLGIIKPEMLSWLDTENYFDQLMSFA